MVEDQFTPRNGDRPGVPNVGTSYSMRFYSFITVHNESNKYPQKVLFFKSPKFNTLTMSQVKKGSWDFLYSILFLVYCLDEELDRHQRRLRFDVFWPLLALRSVYTYRCCHHARQSLSLCQW